MVSEEEFAIVAMIAMFFAFTTLMLLLRGRGLKKRLWREEERSLHLTRALAPAASVVAAPALAQERPARDEELVELAQAGSGARADHGREGAQPCPRDRGTAGPLNFTRQEKKVLGSCFRRGTASPR